MEDKEKKEQDTKNNKQVVTMAVETPFDLWTPQTGSYLPVQDPAQIQPGRGHAIRNLFFQMYTTQ